MAVGGAAELFFGVHAERTPLENIAKPLTVVDAEQAAVTAPAPSAEPDVSPEHLAALRDHERAEEERARAAEHRAAGHELAAEALRATNGAGGRRDIEKVLADIAESRANGLDELATSHEEQANADRAGDDLQRQAAVERAAAAKERARIHQERAEALAAEHDADAQMHVHLADAASERARAREQRALADEARSQAQRTEGPDATLARALAGRHETWAQMHSARAMAHVARAAGNAADADRHDREAETHQERALAADERVDAARRRVAVAALQREEGAVEQTEHERAQAAERERQARERDERIGRRLARQEEREHEGLRQFLPGPGRTLYSPGMVGTASRWAPTAEQDLDREIAAIAGALDERGPTDRDQLAELVGARYWGPGRFRAALGEAVDEGRAQRLSRNTYAPPDAR
ncbi:MAG: hypothetical protein QOJ07_2705, partial [Thermoleophilaceae bacterium]|nr:hypothetical protein [Thermoleophilaceae bacterium]